jgi:hypothetical protein
VTIAQDEVIRRFVRAIFHNHLPLTLGGTEVRTSNKTQLSHIFQFLLARDQTPGQCGLCERFSGAKRLHQN